VKTLALVSRHYPGVASVFSHGRSLGLWDVGFVEDIRNVNELSSYSLVIFGAYHQLYEQVMRSGKKQKKVLLWTSSPGQTGFREIDILKRVFQLHKEGYIHELWFGSEEFSEIFKNDENVFHFPYPFSLKFMENNLPKLKSNLEVTKNNVALFSPRDPRKNLFVQYHAFVLAQRECKDLVFANFFFFNPTLSTALVWLCKIIIFGLGLRLIGTKNVAEV